MSTLVDSQPPRIVVVIPNINGEAELPAAIDSVLKQTISSHLIVVDNGSTDGSLALLQSYGDKLEIIEHSTNKGYAGGVNPGLRRAIEMGADYVAPFNNDAVADPRWLEHQKTYLDEHPQTGMTSCTVASVDGSHLDSTGDIYTTWGLPYPRGRGEMNNGQYDRDTVIFAASGAAPLYRVSMLKQIGLLDEDFFAYYEDIDLSFRAQLAGWEVAYVPQSVVHHATSTTSNKMKGFATLQTHKNLPMLLIKNVPGQLLFTVVPRFCLVYCSFFVAAAQRGQLKYALQGFVRFIGYLPKKLAERHRIQKHRAVPVSYISGLLTWDLPPNATRIRRLRSLFWKLTLRRGA